MRAISRRQYVLPLKPPLHNSRYNVMRIHKTTIHIVNTITCFRHTLIPARDTAVQRREFLHRRHCYPAAGSFCFSRFSCSAQLPAGLRVHHSQVSSALANPPASVFRLVHTGEDEEPQF